MSDVTLSEDDLDELTEIANLAFHDHYDGGNWLKSMEATVIAVHAWLARQGAAREPVWQPISTAPLRTLVLVCCRNYEDSGWFIEKSEKPTGRRWIGSDGSLLEPVYWMPLPTGPEE